jgi:hypothetical protein
MQRARANADRPARVHRLIGYAIVIHAAFALLAIFAALHYGLFAFWFDRMWVAFFIIWALWLFPLFLHSGRSLLRVIIPLVVSLLFIVPCALRFALLAPRIFAGTDRMPTVDRANIVESQSLGGGFRRVATEEFVASGFESIYHGEYLNFKKRRLAYFVSSSLSPSHTYAAYADSYYQSEPREGPHPFRVYIFRAADEQTFQVTAEPLYYVGEFTWEWHEPEGYLLLHFRDGRAPERFQLPPTGPN